MNFERQAADEAAKDTKAVENVEDAQEGAIPDDEAEVVAGGRSTYAYLRSKGYTDEEIRETMSELSQNRLPRVRPTYY